MKPNTNENILAQLLRSYSSTPKVVNENEMKKPRRQAGLGHGLMVPKGLHQMSPLYLVML